MQEKKLCPRKMICYACEKCFFRSVYAIINNISNAVRNHMYERNAVFCENTAVFRCPLCGADIYAHDSSLKCSRGHDFSLSRKGYCDFAPQKHAALYTRELFECRRRILRSRLYDKTVRTLRELLAAYSPEGPVLDAGCGEGTFLLNTAGADRLCFGADLAREGIRLAASGGNGLGWVVADLAGLPFKDKTFGAVLNILSPAAYPEFKRILRPGGILIKVVPGERYLAELRTLTDKQPHSNEKVVSLFDAHFHRIDTAEIEDTFTLSSSEAEDLFKMTPLTEHVKTEAASPAALKSITVHLCFLVGRDDQPACDLI